MNEIILKNENGVPVVSSRDVLLIIKHGYPYMNR